MIRNNWLQYFIVALSHFCPCCVYSVQ